MDVVQGVEDLRPEHGRLFVVIGVFDGLHRGHAYLLEHLRTEADRRGARPTVITFDHHPDEVIQGAAPPLLLHPAERLDLLAKAGVRVTVVQHFDETVRRIPYDAFVGMISSRVDLAGFLMTPDAAFGFERRGTPEAVTALGARDGFDVVVVPPFVLDGAPVRSSDVRAAIAAGDLGRARELLGRDVTVTGIPRVDGDALRLEFEVPVALPPPGTYRASVEGQDVEIDIGRDRTVRVRPGLPVDGAAPLQVVVHAVR
jgi:riboflavin kinase/FMN adenylyltransferase